MRFPSRQTTVEELPGLTGTVRLDRRTASLVPRLRPGDIAVIDEIDLDRASAEALMSRGVAAVVDAAPLISGRYPNLGPEVLARAGVLLVDGVGTGVFGRLRDGGRVRVHDGDILVDGEPVASGRVLDRDGLAVLLEEARSGLSAQLQSLTHNAGEFLRREQELLLHGRGIPDLRTRIEGRPVVVVARGYDYREDLRRLRRFIREQHPVLLGVDAGADALLAAGHRPDIVVVGDEALDQGSAAGERGTTISDRALHSAGEVVLHADTAGHAAGADRLHRLGVPYLTLAASGTTEDVSLLLGDVSGASLLVAVGSHATLDEFLDRQRSGLASTFLTRLRVGPKLVDARGVPQLYAGRLRLWHLLLVLLAGLVALGVALAATPVGQEWWASLSAALSDVPDWIHGRVS
jgi:uncharacterized membrane-anchored protein